MSALVSIVGAEVEAWVGDRGWTLRPTLRAAIGVYGLDEQGFAGVVDRLRTGEFGVALEVFGLGVIPATGSIARADLWDAFANGDLTARLSEYVLILANGGEPLRPREASGQGGGAGMTHGDYLARLYKLATGWLGWSHEQALDAPMPSIVSAYIGRQDMLAAIFGGPKKTTPSRNEMPLDEKVRIAMAGARKVERPRSGRAT